MIAEVFDGDESEAGEATCSVKEGREGEEPFELVAEAAILPSSEASGWFEEGDDLQDR